MNKLDLGSAEGYTQPTFTNKVSYESYDHTLFRNDT